MNDWSSLLLNGANFKFSGEERGSPEDKLGNGLEMTCYLSAPHPLAPLPGAAFQSSTIPFHSSLKTLPTARAVLSFLKSWSSRVSYLVQAFPALFFF